MTTIITIGDENGEGNTTESLPGTTICNEAKDRLAELIPDYYTNTPDQNYAFLDKRFREKQKAIREGKTI